jgi:hypothetical protein
MENILQSKKSLIIWMDFSVAYLMECTKNEVLTFTIKSGNYLLLGKHKSLIDSNIQNLPNQEQLSSYYRRISNYIIDYEDVILLGPSGSKNELFNLLLLNPDFDCINMSIRDAGKMNNHERETLIRNDTFRTSHTLSSLLTRENSIFRNEPSRRYSSVV